MATVLSIGDIAIVHYNTSTDAFTFVFLREVEAGTIVNFTDNGWLAAGGFRPGEQTVTYTAPTAITAGTIVTLTGLNLDDAGDQIIAYQGDPATPTILQVVDFADGNNTVAGDATDDNTTALPPGFTLGINAVAVGFDQALYAGPINGSAEGLFTALNNSANWLDSDTLPVRFTFDAKPIIDLDADNSTHLGRDYDGSVISGGPAVPVAAVDLDIDDFDDFDLTAAEFRIIGFDVRDVLAINGSLPDGIVATPYRAADGTIRLEGRASHDDYETAIRQVVFSTTDTPGDQKRIKVSVFDGRSWSQETTAFIEIVTNLTAAPPALDLDANNSTGGGADATATFTSGGPAISVTDTDVSITADAPAIASATITILGWSLHAGDELSAGTLPTGITASSYNPLTGVITLSGEASLADYQTALRQVVFDTTSTSTADRGIQVTVTDSSGLISNLATMYMHVVSPPPNVAPVIDLDANNSTTTGANYLTGFTEGGSPVAIADADISIIDSDSPSLASATITLTNPQTDDVLTFEGTPPPGITVSGSGSSVVTLTGGASSVSYQTALQQIKFSNGNIDPSNITRTIEVTVSDGTSNSNTATALVQVEAVNNSAPVIDLDPDDSTGTVRTTFRTVFTENGAPLPIADTDISITDLDSTTLVLATITLANQRPGDLLTIATLPLPGGIVASAYDPGTGVLTLAGTATLDDYEAALRQIRYSNDSDNPDTVDRLIEVTVNDGANTSNVAAAVIGVVPVNDAPDVVLEGTVYVENAATVTLDPLAAVTDIDDAELSQVVIQITSGGLPGDFLTANGGATGGTVDGITFNYDAAEHAMVLTGASSVLSYQNLLRTVGYHSTSDNPTDFGAEAIRILTWTVSDGTAVTTTTTTLDILAVNDAPQAAVAATASYTENAAPVVLSPASTATDVDNVTLVAGEIRIVSGAVDGDLLTVNGLQSGTFLNIEFSYDPLLRSLTFTHPSLIADYEAFLEAVAFSSTSDNPTNSGLNPTRTLSWFIFDGDAISDLQTTVLTITAVNDPPVAQDGSASGNEDAPVSGTLVATDVDSPSLTYSLGTQAAHGIVVVNADGSFIYTPAQDFNGTDSFTFLANDGLADSNIATISLTVTAVNDAPVNTVPGAQTVNEDTALAIAGLSVADVDSPTLTTTLTVTNGTLAIVAGAARVTGFLTNSLTISGTIDEVNAALASVNYLGNPNFAGSDTLTVTTDDGTTTPDVDTVAITIAAVADAPELDLDPDNSSGAPGSGYITAFTENGAPAPLADADISLTDADDENLVGATFRLINNHPGDTLVVIGTLPPGITSSLVGNELTLSGTASVAAYMAALGQIAFNNPGEAPEPGNRLILVNVDDGGATTNAFVIVQVEPVNDAPVAQGGSASGNEDTPINGALVATDVDSEGLTYRLGTQATHGTVVVNPDGSYTYTPAQDFSGTDSFTFLANDGEADSNAATISLNIAAVNDPPVAQDGSASGSEDAPIIGTLIATDVDSEGLTYRLGTQAAHGTVVVNPDGTFTYTPNQDFNGADSFTFLANDGGVDSNAATISLSIAAVNDPPVAQDGSVNGTEDTPIGGTLIATDIDSESLTYRLGVQAAHGTVVVNPNGTFTYAPNPDFFGTDSFTFLTNDGAVDSNVATISLTIAGVNDPPQLDLDADDSTAPSTYFVATFTGTNVPVADADVAIADLDSATLASATIHLLTPVSGDALSVNGALPAGIIASAYDPTTGILTLSGEASLAGYQTAIHQIAFGTTDPSLTSRIIEITVNDGTHDSNTAVAMIDLEAPPEPPEPPPATVFTHWMATNQFTHPAGWSPNLVGDFAGDDMIDLIWRSDSSGSLDEWQIVNGGWTRSVDLGGHPVAGLQPASAGDFDGDGTEDILWFDPANGNTDIWQMGNGEHTASLSLGPHPPGFQVAGTGDFDGDGTTDILFFSAQTGALDIWKIENGQWAGSVDPGPAPAGFSIADTGDVNHDGSDDVVWFNSSSGDVHIWQMENGQLAESVDIGPHPPGYTIIGSDDFTGDGTDDILWFNQATGNVDLWKMEDGHWAGSVDIGFHPPGWQPIGIGDTDANGIADVWWRQGTSTHVEIWLLSID